MVQETQLGISIRSEGKEEIWNDGHLVPKVKACWLT